MRISADITQAIFVFVFLICICEKDMWLTSRRSYLTPSLPLKTASTGVDSKKIIIYYYHYYSLLHYYLIIYLTRPLPLKTASTDVDSEKMGHFWGYLVSSLVQTFTSYQHLQLRLPFELFPCVAYRFQPILLQYLKWPNGLIQLFPAHRFLCKKSYIHSSIWREVMITQ